MSYMYNGSYNTPIVNYTRPRSTCRQQPWVGEDGGYSVDAFVDDGAANGVAGVGPPEGLWECAQGSVGREMEVEGCNKSPSPVMLHTYESTPVR